MATEGPEGDVVARSLPRFGAVYQWVLRMHPIWRSELLHTSVLPDQPWQKLREDILSFEDKDYMVVVDYHSRWLEIV